MGYLAQTYEGIAYGSNGTEESPEWTPHGRHSNVAAYIKPQDAGTAKLQRKDSSGNWADITDAIPITAGAELPILFGGPVTTIRVSFTNTDASAGTFRVEFVEGGRQ